MERGKCTSILPNAMKEEKAAPPCSACRAPFAKVISPASRGRCDYFSPYSADYSFIAVALDGKQGGIWSRSLKNLQRERGLNQIVGSDWRRI